MLTSASMNSEFSNFQPLPLMNLALRGSEADFGPEHADTFRCDLHPYLRLSRHGETTPDADYVLANPPFIDSDWFRKDDDVRWHGAAAETEQLQVDPHGAARQRRQFGVPPKGDANFAWVQHFISKIAPQGMAV